MKSAEKYKLYNIALQKLKDEYKPTKLDCKNLHWKEEWLPFIQYNNHWDWAYLYELIMYKLKLFRIYLDIYSSTTDEYRIPILESLDETIAAGEYVYNHNYEEDAHKFMDAHTTPIVCIYKYSKADKDVYSDKNLLVKLKCPRGQGDSFDDCIPYKQVIDYWLKENGYKESMITCTYSSEWDSESNHDKWITMSQNSEDRRQEDWLKFFTLIAKHMREWWD